MNRVLSWHSIAWLCYLPNFYHNWQALGRLEEIPVSRQCCQQFPELLSKLNFVEMSIDHSCIFSLLWESGYRSTCVSVSLSASLHSSCLVCRVSRARTRWSTAAGVWKTPRQSSRRSSSRRLSMPGTSAISLCPNQGSTLCWRWRMTTRMTR